jgi:hypothetical protein
MTLSLLKGEI